MGIFWIHYTVISIFYNLFENFYNVDIFSKGKLWTRCLHVWGRVTLKLVDDNRWVCVPAGMCHKGARLLHTEKCEAAQSVGERGDQPFPADPEVLRSGRVSVLTGEGYNYNSSGALKSIDWFQLRQIREGVSEEIEDLAEFLYKEWSLTSKRIGSIFIIRFLKVLGSHLLGMVLIFTMTFWCEFILFYSLIQIFNENTWKGKTF